MTKTRILNLLLVCFVVASILGILNLKRIDDTERQLTTIQDSIENLTAEQASTSEIVSLAQENNGSTSSLNSPAKTQDQLITSAVAKALPAVVSIVITKDVPDLEVSYVNPFGDSPLFKDFGLSVPVYKQKGVRTQKIGAGSGFIVSHDGYILTNKHVVDDEEAEYTVLLSDGSKKAAKIIYRDKKEDVAVAKIEGNYSTILPLGDSSNLKLGQTVLAIGNALGEYSNTISVGIISGLNRSIEAAGQDGKTEQFANVIQTDASINLGNSGGPLIDLNGKVLGINVATIYGSNNISFAMPINELKKVIHTYTEI